MRRHLARSRWPVHHDCDDVGLLLLSQGTRATLQRRWSVKKHVSRAWLATWSWSATSRHQQTCWQKTLTVTPLRSVVFLRPVVFGIGPAKRPESPSPSGVAQGCSLIPVDSAGEVAGVVCAVEGEENTGRSGVE